MARSQRTAAYVSALKVPLTILCLFGTALAAYYFFYVTLHRTYLVERNFRLLATLGEQIVASIDSDQRVIQNLVKGDPLSDSPSTDSRLFDWYDETHTQIRPRAANLIPFLRSAKVSVAWSDDPDTYVLQVVEPESRFVWMRRNDKPANAGRTSTVQVGLNDLLGPLLSIEAGKGIFDALLIAAPDGRVLFQSGDANLRIANLDRLIQRADAKTPAELAFTSLARSPSMVDVVVSGSEYKLFTQPCCGQMVRDPAPLPATAEGWVLCGIIAQRTLSKDSYAVSFSILILLSAMLLLGLLSWPFLKLTFLGEAQRVKASDVVLVATCTLVGVSLLTIGALDYFAYDRRLQPALDDQLLLLAKDIDRQAGDEVASASKELQRLQSVVKRLPATPGRRDNLARSRVLFEGDTLDAYPFFDSFSLIDEDGEQRRKLTLGSVGTLFIEVRDRDYFTHWPPARSRDTSSRPESAMPSPEANALSLGPTPPPFLEAIRSNTTGEREAVLSIPSSVEGYRVAALSIPMHALIDPVVVPGFGFAVINGDGKVLFHSDPQHSLSENFFVEADRNRRLRALVGARHMELVDIQYWGDEHRALVFPMSVGQQWTLVAFYDKDLIQTVNVEWLVLTLVLLVMYTGAYVIVSLGILFVRPRYRAPWLWPDPQRSKQYVELFPPLILLCAAFALAIAVLPVGELVAAAWLMPFFGSVFAYYSLNPPTNRRRPTWSVLIGLAALAALLVLALRVGDPVSRASLFLALGAPPAWIAWSSARRDGDSQWALALPVSVSYGLTAYFFVILTAVLPAAAFFRVGHAMQMESFVKYGQLQFALDRAGDRARDAEVNAQHRQALIDENGDALWRTAAADKLESAREKKPEWGLYQKFFFATAPVSQSECGDRDGADEISRSGPSSAIPGILEELLPFYSESSVHLRELAHDQAADRSWSWRRSGADLIFCARADADSPFKSTVPRLLAAGPPGGSAVTDVLVIVVSLSMLAGAIIWLVRFALHKVFVVGAMEPIWSRSSATLEPVWGPNLFLVSREPIGDPPDASNYCVVDLAHVPDDRSEQAAWFDEQFERLERSPAGQNALLMHFEHRLQDPAISAQKLALLERVMAALNRTIVILSAVPPGRLTAARAVTVPADVVDPEQAGWVRRWKAVFSKFTIVPVAAATPAPRQPSPAALADWTTAGWREILWRINALGFAHSAKFLDDERRDTVVDRLWKDVLPYAWHPDRPALDINQLLVEVGERSENHYREIWESCTPPEKLVLGQIADEGLVNQKTERTVRMLMARGLVRRQPNFVVMNETFRQFVLSASSRAEVTVLEGQEASTWDAIRWPFLILLVGSMTFFFATQHELFNSALGILTGLAATLPAVAKMASLFGDRKNA
jgi:hypothetical protein